MFASVWDRNSFHCIFICLYTRELENKETAKGMLSDIARLVDRRCILSSLHLQLERVGAIALSQCIMFDDLRNRFPRIPDSSFLMSKSFLTIAKNILHSIHGSSHKGAQNATMCSRVTLHIGIFSVSKQQKPCDRFKLKVPFMVPVHLMSLLRHDAQGNTLLAELRLKMHHCRFLPSDILSWHFKHF